MKHACHQWSIPVKQKKTLKKVRNVLQVWYHHDHHHRYNNITIENVATY